MAKCVSCNHKGLLFKVDKHGLCAQCAPRIQADIDKHTEVIYEEMHVFERATTQDEKVRSIGQILASAETLVKFEELGLQTCSPPARLVLDEYRGFREALEQEAP